MKSCAHTYTSSATRDFGAITFLPTRVGGAAAGALLLAGAGLLITLVSNLELEGARDITVVWLSLFVTEEEPRKLVEKLLLLEAREFSLTCLVLNGFLVCIGCSVLRILEGGARDVVAVLMGSFSSGLRFADGAANGSPLLCCA